MKEIEQKEKVAQFNNGANKKVVVAISRTDKHKQSYSIKEAGIEIDRGDEIFIDLSACFEHVMKAHGYDKYQECAEISSIYYLDDNTKLIIYEANKQRAEIVAIVIHHQVENMRKTYSATTSHPVIIDDVVKFLKIDPDAQNINRYNYYQTEKP